MPRRRKPPKLKLMVEYEMDRPDPEEISKGMVDETHQNIMIHVANQVPKNIGFADGRTARLVRVTKVVR